MLCCLTFCVSKIISVIVEHLILQSASPDLNLHFSVCSFFLTQALQSQTQNELPEHLQRLFSWQISCLIWVQHHVNTGVSRRDLLERGVTCQAQGIQQKSMGDLESLLLLSRTEYQMPNSFYCTHSSYFFLELETKRNSFKLSVSFQAEENSSKWPGYRDHLPPALPCFVFPLNLYSLCVPSQHGCFIPRRPLPFPWLQCSSSGNICSGKVPAQFF